MAKKLKGINRRWDEYGSTRKWNKHFNLGNVRFHNTFAKMTWRQKKHVMSILKIDA